MKIDPINKTVQVQNPTVMVPREKPQDFGAVFEETVQKTDGIQSGRASAIPPGAEAMMGWTGPPDLIPTPDVAAHELLDTLEHYQAMIGDASADLKSIEPLVARMQKQVAIIEPVLDALSDGHPVKGIIQEAIMHISREIDNFNSGHYVDRN